MPIAISIVFETHSISEDNESRRASFTSDLRRATETAEIAFNNTTIPIFHDWRLRECDYGDLNGMDTDTLRKERKRYCARRYPNGESWQEAVSRVGRFWMTLN